MARYESEFTLFMKDLKKQRPDLEKKQPEGRERLWDVPFDATLQRQFDAAKIENPPV